jgi:hypothetical protein
MMTIRKVIGLLIALFGILLGAAMSGFTAIITLGYWNAKETGGWEGRINLLATIAFSILLGYGIYLLGRRIAR